MTPFKKRVVLLLLTTAAAVPVIGAAPVAPSTRTATAQVTIDNFRFTPADLTVAPGTTVTWTNRDDSPHTVTATGEKPAFASKALDTEDSFRFVFTRPGTYRYYCKIHPHMTGIIVVK